jgi:hypothetical protein
LIVDANLSDEAKDWLKETGVQLLIGPK